MNLKNLKPVGGFYRYGFSIYIHGQHDLDEYGVTAVNLALLGVSAAGENVLKTAETLCGGHRLTLDQIIVMDNLVIFTDEDHSWQVAFGDTQEHYLRWLRQGHGLTAAQYEKELKRQPYEPRIKESDEE